MNLFLPCFGLSAALYNVHTCAFTVTAIGDPALRPGIPQPWYWHGTVPQGSDRFNLTEEASPPNLFLSSCTYSMVDNESRRIESITSLSLNPPPSMPIFSCALEKITYIQYVHKNQPVIIGAEATVYVWFLGQIYIIYVPELYCTC